MTRYSFTGTDTIWRVVLEIPAQDVKRPIWNYTVNPAVIDHYETTHHEAQRLTYGPYANKRPATQVRNKTRKEHALWGSFKDVKVTLEECVPEWYTVDEA